MNIGRILRHLCTPHRSVQWKFPASSMRAIGEAIRLSETRHSGQIRFAVESALEVHPLFHGMSASARAGDVFAHLRIWDTEENNGVLIYLLLADRHVEIVADRGVHARTGATGWEAICRRMEVSFRAGRFEAGVLEGIEAVTEILAREYPATGKSANNELPDQPVVMG